MRCCTWATCVVMASAVILHECGIVKLLGAMGPGSSKTISFQNGIDDNDSALLPGTQTTEKQPRFPDFGFLPPAGQYKGKHFRLSQNYPQAKVEAKKPEFLAIPFHDNAKEENWLKYMLAVRNYCLEGFDEAGWDANQNHVRKWYHAPWQHWGRSGREGINGLTREATAQPGQLAPSQTGKFQTYAVSFYNDVGAYTIGKVWKNPLKPAYKNIRFDSGTVVFKLLFTQAPVGQVPYLSPPIEWQAYTERADDDIRRSVQTLRLIQMDIMVRDDRATELTGAGWVFGTYCYNGTAMNKSDYRNLVPVGLQWGNDPGVMDDRVNPKPSATFLNSDLRQVKINSQPSLPPQHLGWNGRLNGPADYYASSCMSCHATAQYPVMRYQNPEFGTRKVSRG